MRFVRTLWALTLTSGLLLGAAIVHHGYEADRKYTSGAPGTLETTLALVLLLALAAAIAATVRARRTSHLPALWLSRTELLVMLVGLVASVLFAPALVVVVGVVGRAVWRTLRPVPHAA